MFTAILRASSSLRPPLPAASDYFLLVDFDCAGGGRPTFFASIRQVAQVRIV
jgi:hypothetical protein